MALIEFGSISANQSIQLVQSILLTGNTAGNTTITGGDIYLSLSGNITGSINGSTLQLSVGTAGGAADGVNIISAGTQQAGTNATVVFSNSNGITFGMSNSSIVTASHDGLTSQSNQALSGSNGSFTFQTVTFGNLNGLSFYTSNGSMVGSYSVPTQSNQDITLYATGNTTQNSSTVLNANSLLFRGTGNASLGFSNGSIIISDTGAPGGGLTNINISAGTTSNNASNFTFADSNGISFGLNAGTITATVKTDYLTTAMASNRGTDFVQATAAFAGTNASGTIASDGISISVNAQSSVNQNASLYGLGNTTQNSSTVLSLNALSFNAIGSLTVGYSNGSIQLSAPNAITTARASTDAIGLNTAQTNATWTVNSNGLSINAAGYAGTNTTFNGANISASITQNSNGIQISASVAAPGGGGATKSTYIPYYPASTGAQTLGAQGVTSASAWFFPISIQDAVRFNRIEQLMTASWISTTVAASHTVTHQFGIFSNNAETLSLISSSSYSLAVSCSSISASLSYPSAYATAGGYTYTTVGASSTATAQSLFGTAGNRVMTFGFGNTMELTAGLYWLGIHQRQSSVGANAGMAMALGGNVMAAAQNIGGMGSSTAAYTGTNNTLIKIPWGVATSTGSAGYGGSQLPSAVNITAMGMTASQMPMMTFISR